MFSWRVIGLVTVFSVLLQSTDVLAALDGNVGDSCTTKTGISGECAYISNCAAALDDISKGKYPEDLCGFDSTKPIVCCKRVTTPTITTTQRPVITRPTGTTVRAPPVNMPGLKSLESNVGDSCTTKTGISGECAYISNCAAALDDILKGKYPEDLCGLDSTKPIVCCKRVTTPTITTTQRPVITRPTGTTVRAPPVNMPGLKSLEMCEKYSKYAFETKESPTLSIIQRFTTTLECAFEKEKLIVGGRAASRQEFPHMTQIGYTDGGQIQYGCGGSLISEIFVLTAGHCLADRTWGAASFVRVGFTNITDLTYAQTRKVKDIIKYPDYVNKKYHDIGLLKMESAFAMNPYVRPACLFIEKIIPVKNALVSGWGSIKFMGEGSDTLLKVTLEFFSPASCNKTYRRDIIQPGSALKDGFRDDIMICAGSRDFKDACQGDSGGPLQIYHEESKFKCMYDIVGVTSFGKSCAEVKNTPGVYTRVSAYIQWIENVVWG